MVVRGLYQSFSAHFRAAGRRRMMLCATLVLVGVLASQTAATSSGEVGRSSHVSPGVPAKPARRWPVSFLTGPRQERRVPSALTYFNTRSRHLGLSSADLAGYRVTTSYTDAYNGVTHVTLQQRYRGLDVIGAVASVNVARSGAIINLHSSFLPHLGRRADSPVPRSSARQAVSAAARALGLRQTAPLRRVRTTPPGFRIAFSPGGLALGSIPVRLVYAESASGAIRLAWNIRIYEQGGGHLWDVALDAASLRLLSKTDLVRHADESYRVFAAPAESPDVAGRSLVVNPADPAASPYGWLDTNGQPGADTTITDGNNMHVGVDADHNGVLDPGSEADGGAGLSFDFPLDLMQSLSANTSAAVANLFYWGNYVHDVTYRYGFTEAAGNFQQTNSTGQGLGGDPVIVLDQNGFAVNATTATTPDGSSPVIRMGINAGGRPAMTTLHITAPAQIAGDVPASTALFGTDTAGGAVSGAMTISSDTTLCSTPSAQAFAGTIAYADRGVCTFKTKALNAQLGGATALVIGDNRVEALPQLPDDPNTPQAITIPTVMVSQADGASISAQLAAQVEVDATVTVPDIPARDMAFDNGVLVHEYMHAITQRLVGGGATCATSGPGSESPDEGWSDFLALVLTARDTDTSTTSRPIGAWSLGSPGGFRPTPYSTDMNVDPATYDDIKTMQEYHDVGYVWASMLWDMYWNLVGAHGYAPIQNHDLTSGNGLALQLVLDGQKLTPCYPGFVDARDGILQADLADTGGQNQCLIWRAFAKRGLGVSAVQGDSQSLVDGTEAFDVPAQCARATTTSVTSSVSPSNPGQLVKFTAAPRPVTGAGTPTGTATFVVDGSPLATIPLSHGSAVYSTSSLSVGSHTVTATYRGDSRFGGSTSAPFTQDVSEYAIVDPSSPAPGSTWTAGQKVAVQTALTNVSGSQTKACAGCSVTVGFAKVGGTPSQAVGPLSMKYDSIAKQYTATWKVTGAAAKWGLTSLTVSVAYPGTATTTSKAEAINLSAGPAPWDNTWAGTSISHVSIDNAGGQVTVAPGSTVNVAINWSIADSGCPGCQDQIEVGWNDQGPQQCIYDGQPGAVGATGAAAFSLTAPSTAGVYYLAYDEGGDYGCGVTLPIPGPDWFNGDPPNPNRQIIGRVNVSSTVAKFQHSAVKISAVHVNGKGSDVTVSGGSTVNVTLNYAISDKPCLGCVDQIEVGLNNAAGPTGCIYNGQPGTGTTGSAAFSLTAPSTAGSYFIAFDRAADFGCLVSTTDWWNQTPQANPRPGETQFIAHLTVN